MNRKGSITIAASLALSGVLALGTAGCDREVAGELATLSGVYLGDMVTALATGCMRDDWGIEDGGAHDEHTEHDGHSHEAAPLHDHEH